MNNLFTGKRIAVTGGTGSIGRALVEKILSAEHGQPKSVTVFSRDEAKQWQMRREIQADELRFVIGDIRDYQSVSEALSGIDMVFHMSAMKQVPACEKSPAEAVATNVIGAENIVRAIRTYRLPVECVVGCSTDKACNPVSVMGMTKAIQERIFVEANNGSSTRFMCCRFGNVPGSRGSVIPLWKEQIAKGMAITITDPQMTRFLLPARRAAEIMIKAAAVGEAGEIFVPEMASCTLATLAKAMFDCLGGGIILPISPRTGERQHEVIISREESLRATKVRGEDFYLIEPYAYDSEQWEYRSDDPASLMFDPKELAIFLLREGVL
jgi:FlaA1/EpsC-like NDP-sugar epimerase